MQVGILGPVTTWTDDGDEIALSGSKQRGVLAMLALHADRAVAVDALARGVWGHEDADDVLTSLRPTVSRLRGLLADPGDTGHGDRMLQHRNRTYTLACGRDGTDLGQVALLRESARERDKDDPEAAARLLRDALEHWRGPALADVRDLPFAQPEAARLDRLHVDMVEEWADASLRAGRPREVAERLDAVLEAHPGRERLWSLLMLARYRLGSQLDALAAYQSLRDHLVEHGLDPGPEVQALHAAILRQDPSLDAAAPVAGHHPDGQLPRAWTSFVGRDVEQHAVAACVQGQPLVTLVGTGGAGKTRLAVEVAGVEQSRGRRDVRFIELADLREATGVARAVAASMSIPEQPYRALPNTIADTVGDRPMLLVLDNCEHVLAGVQALVRPLLAACTGVRVLATSRQPLGITGEVTWHIEPLTPPSPGETASQVRTNAAVQLFADRAAAARPGFVLDDESLPTVAEICRRLDGIPLALELAAARVRMLGLDDLAVQLEHRFHLLAGSSGEIGHHRTLQAALDWSHDLLDDAERALLPRLSVFAGGATVDVVASLFAEVAEPLPALLALAEKSLLVVDHRPRKATRYRMLETVREWAAALADQDDLAVWRQRHAEHMLGLCQRGAAEVCGPDQARWIAALEDDHDNVRAALSWGVTTGDEQVALATVGAMWLFWWRHGHIPEGAEWVARARAAAPDADPGLQAPALVGEAYLRWKLGAFDEAGATGEAALELFERLQAPPGAAAALGVLGMVARDRGEAQDAEQLVRRAQQRYVECDDAWGQAATGNMLVSLARDRGDERAAAELLVETTAAFEAIGDQWGVAWSAWLGGRVATRLGDLDLAAERLRHSIVLARQLQHGFGIVVGLAGLVGVDAARGRGRRSAVLLGATEALEAALGYPARAIERDDCEHDAAAIAALLAPSELEKLRRHGATLGWDAAVAFAMTDDELPVG